MKYIYESTDNGKTIYRRPIGVKHAERELVDLDEIVTGFLDDTILISIEGGMMVTEDNDEDINGRQS